jgi:hypothetical protein
MLASRDDAGEKMDTANARKGNLKDRFVDYKDSLFGRIPQVHKGQGCRASGPRQDDPHRGDYSPPPVHHCTKVHLFSLCVPCFLLTRTSQVIAKCQRCDDYQQAIPGR